MQENLSCSSGCLYVAFFTIGPIVVAMDLFFLQASLSWWPATPRWFLYSLALSIFLARRSNQCNYQHLGVYYRAQCGYKRICCTVLYNQYGHRHLFSTLFRYGLLPGFVAIWCGAILLCDRLLHGLRVLTLVYPWVVEERRCDGGSSQHALIAARFLCRPLAVAH